MTSWSLEKERFCTAAGRPACSLCRPCCRPKRPLHWQTSGRTTGPWTKSGRARSWARERKARTRLNSGGCRNPGSSSPSSSEPTPLRRASLGGSTHSWASPWPTESSCSSPSTAMPCAIGTSLTWIRRWAWAARPRRCCTCALFARATGAPLCSCKRGCLHRALRPWPPPVSARWRRQASRATRSTSQRTPTEFDGRQGGGARRPLPGPTTRRWPGCTSPAPPTPRRRGPSGWQQTAPRLRTMARGRARRLRCGPSQDWR
mmetsp:Transcript_13018/g.49770  ORF Transcript_13018/g.49770 Transcript_13018/m.49770 type:complete len:260 (-) Transcript_13018:464-1243(-)